MQGITGNDTSFRKKSIERIVDTSNALEATTGCEEIAQTLLVEQKVQGSSGGPSLTAYEHFLELKKQFEPSLHGIAKVVIDDNNSAGVGSSK